VHKSDQFQRKTHSKNQVPHEIEAKYNREFRESLPTIQTIARTSKRMNSAMSAKAQVHSGMRNKHDHLESEKQSNKYLFM
jgi:hypothetical protein